MWPHGGDVFIDEVAIDLNPKMGFAWMPRGEQKAIETPGDNRKRYPAGALHAETGLRRSKAMATTRTCF